MLLGENSSADYYPIIRYIYDELKQYVIENSFAEHFKVTFIDVGGDGCLCMVQVHMIVRPTPDALGFVHIQMDGDVIDLGPKDLLSRHPLTNPQAIANVVNMSKEWIASEFKQITP
jgi:hypothetical protein